MKYLLKPKPYLKVILEKTYNQYLEIASRINGKQVTIPELESIKSSEDPYYFCYMSSTHFASLMELEHRDTLTYLSGYSFEKEHGNKVFIRINGIGKISILMKLKRSYPHPQCLKIEKDGKWFYASMKG